MMPRRLLLLATASLGPLLLAVVWFEVLQSRAQAPPSSTPADAPAALVFTDHVERYRDRAGQVTWQLEADQVELLASGDELVTGLRHGQFLSDGRPVLHLRGDRLQRDHRTGNIMARGRLTLLSENGIELRAGSAWWFEAEGRLVIPDLELLQYRDTGDPRLPAVTVATSRAFFWPREGRLECPDPLAGKRGNDSFKAESATVRLADGRLVLAGPAAVDCAIAAEAGGAGRAGLAKRLKGVVDADGTAAYNARSSGLLIEGGGTLEIPADRLQVRAERLVYSRTPAERADVTGDIVVTSPQGTVRAPRAVVFPGNRRIEFAGPVELAYQDGAGGANIGAGRVVYWYDPGRSRAEATGGVTLVSGASRAEAPRARIDLEAQRAVLTGAVRLRHVVDVDGRESTIEVTCRRLVHDFVDGARRSVASAGLKLRTADGDALADELEFDHDREQVTLRGNVRVHGRGGETARCGRAVYDLRTMELTVSEPERATVYVDVDR